MSSDKTEPFSKPDDAPLDRWTDAFPEAWENIRNGELNYPLVHVILWMLGFLVLAFAIVSVGTAIALVNLIYDTLN